MNNFAKVSLLAGLFAVLAQPASAARLNGNYALHTGGLVPLWDVSGSYSNSFSVGAFTYQLSEDLSGQITGVGTFYLGENYLGVPTGLYGVVTNTGSVSGVSTNPTVNLGFSVNGEGDALGLTLFSFTETLNLQLSVNGVNGTMSGGGTDIFQQFSASARPELVSRSTTPVNGVQIQLPAGATGDWRLALNVTAQKGNKYSGTATVTTANGTAANLTVSGSYAVNGVSTLNLAAKGGNLTLTITVASGQPVVKAMKGKLFGQTVNYKAR